MIQHPPSAAETEIKALMDIHPKGFDLSLGRILDLLEKLGNPQRKIPPAIHVAGTNGKGSAIAFCRAILEAAGLSVHVHTSPHLVHWHERYRLGRNGESGRLVEDAVLADAIARVAAANEGRPITVFEVLTAVTFVLFSEHDANVSLIEVGLGGRFDATNVMDDVAVSVITPVAMDHEAYLGDTLAKIAFEKAGIIKPQTPVVAGPQDEDALDVIERQAAKNRAALVASGQKFSAFAEHGRMVFQMEHGDADRLWDVALPRLPGAHQIDNAATAIAACITFCHAQGHELTEAMVSKAMTQVTWPGRMQRLTDGALVDMIPKDSQLWLDGGHNPHAGAVVRETLNHTLGDAPLWLIAGMLDTKDQAGYFRALGDRIGRVLTVPITSSDAGVAAEMLAQTARDAGLTAEPRASLADALATVSGQNDGHPAHVLVGGSLYLVGDALLQNETPPA